MKKKIIMILLLLLLLLFFFFFFYKPKDSPNEKENESVISPQSGQEIIILKNGKRIQGEIEYDEGEDVFFTTPDGKMNLKKKEMEGFEGN